METRLLRRIIGVLMFGGLLFTLASSPLGAQVAGIEQVGDDIDGPGGEEFGRSVDVSADGQRIAVGSRNFQEDVGRVQVFELVNGAWVQLGNDILGDSAGQQLGFSVALSDDGNRLVASTAFAGQRRLVAARVFDWDGSQWTEVRAFGGDPSRGNQLHKVAMSNDGNTIAVGDFNISSVQVFRQDGTGWDFLGDAIIGNTPGARGPNFGDPFIDGDDFGLSVALSSNGNRLAVGAQSIDLGGEGYAAIFDWNGSAWVQAGADIVGEALAGFGTEVRITPDGNTVVIGSPFEGPGGGLVAVYDWSNGSWVQRGADIEGPDGAFYGFTVDIAADGDRVVVGAPIFQDDVGVVEVFDWNGSAWAQVGATLTGEAGDFLGVSTRITPNGDRIGVGAFGGHAAVFDLPIATTVSPLLCGGLNVTVDMSRGQTPTAGDDVIRGTAGDDVINALGGNDTICSLQGNDQIVGGDGNDKVFAGLGNDIVNGGAGNDLLVGGAGNDILNGEAGNDRMQGGDGADTLNGGGGPDVIRGGNGNDLLNGGTHDDQMWGNLGRDNLFGDGGNDVLRGGAWLDVMDGGAGGNDGCTLTDPAGLVETRIGCEGGVFGR